MPTSKPSSSSSPSPSPLSLSPGEPVSCSVTGPGGPASDLATNHDTSADRRRHRRAALDVFANRFQQGYPYLCRATDISRKGMRLYTFNEPQLPASSFSGLQFQLPGCSEVISAAAEVVFEDRASGVVGIRFLHLSNTADAAIGGYLGRAKTLD